RRAPGAPPPGPRRTRFAGPRRRLKRGGGARSDACDRSVRLSPEIMTIYAVPRASQRGPALLDTAHALAARRLSAGWSRPVARQGHNVKVVGSNPTPATK